MMAEQQNTNTYHVPASKEAIVVRSPETASLSEAELAYRQAMESAVSTHALDPTDVDQRRIERLGSSMVAAVELTTPQPEVSFDPGDPAHLIACGEHIIHMRTTAKGDLDLAA